MSYCCLLQTSSALPNLRSHWSARVKVSFIPMAASSFVKYLQEVNKEKNLVEELSKEDKVVSNQQKQSIWTSENESKSQLHKYQMVELSVVGKCHERTCIRMVSTPAWHLLLTDTYCKFQICISSGLRRVRLYLPRLVAAKRLIASHHSLSTRTLSDCLSNSSTY